MTYIILDFISANIIQKGPTSQDGVASQKHFIRAPSTIDIKGSAKSDFSSIIMVMGEAEMFFTWIERLRAISIDNAFVVFLYASYDRLLPRDGCGMVSNGTNVECDTMFIPNTTWTEGRNTLAGKAFKKEILVGSTFDWWLFLTMTLNYNALEKVHAWTRYCNILPVTMCQILLQLLRHKGLFL